VEEQGERVDWLRSLTLPGVELFRHETINPDDATNVSQIRRADPIHL
jgi:hypothetical protein